MAKLYFPDGTSLENLNSIQQILNPIQVELKHWQLPESGVLTEALQQTTLNDDEKESVLTNLDYRFDDLKNTSGYTTRDMIVLHEGTPNLDEIMRKFESIHYHDDDEVRYIVDGKGYFGFVLPENKQVLVEVGREDYINVPAKTEHWFTLGESRGIKAIRYFIDTSGWVPEYTDRNIAFNADTLPW